MTPQYPRPQPMLAIAGFLPAIMIAALAMLPWPWAGIPALLLGNALAMAAALHVFGATRAPWNGHMLRHVPAHLARFSLACLLLATLCLWPVLQLQRTLSLLPGTLLVAALLLDLLALWPFWTRFGGVFLQVASHGEEADTAGAAIAQRFVRRRVLQPHHLVRDLPALLALLLLTAGVFVASGLMPMPGTASLPRWTLPLAYALLVLPFGNLLLAARTLSLPAQEAFRADHAGSAAGNEEIPAFARTGIAPRARSAFGDVVLPTGGTAATPDRTPDIDTTAIGSPSPAADERTAAAPPPPRDPAALGQELLEAARQGDTAAALALLEAGAPADPSASRNTPDQRSALALAAVLPDSRLLRALIAKGAEVNRMQSGMAALHAATRDSWHGRDEAVLALLANGADPRLRDAEGRTPLHGAALSGNPNIAAMLLDAGAAINALDNQGMSALSLACRAANWTLAVFLLEHGAAADPAEGEPPLVAACSIGEDDIAGARLLLKHRAKVDANDRLGRTALMAAALEGRPAQVKLLLAAGADVRHTDRNGTTALMEAARAGSHEIIASLGAAGADALAQDGYGRDALILACQSPRADAASMQALLELGADPTRRGSDGRSALDHASTAGRWDLVAALAPDIPLPASLRGQALPAPGADSPADLLEALRGEHWAAVSAFESVIAGWPPDHLADLYLQLGSEGYDGARRWLLDHGVHGDTRLDDGARLFDALVDRLPDSLEALEDLLEQGASPAGGGLLARALAHLGNAPEGAALAGALLQRGADAFGPTDDGRTPLSLAAAAGWQAALEALLACGADPNARDARARTPLHHALAHSAAQALPLVRNLVRAGADPLAAGDNGETPLGLALAQGDAALIDWLRWDGGFAQPHRILRPEDLPAAAASGDLAAVRRLLQLGFPVDHPDAAGYSALFHACGRGHVELAGTLIDAGARTDALGTSGISCLAAAVNGRQRGIVTLLLDRGAAIDQPLAGGARALMLAAARGSTDVLEQLLLAGAEVNATSEHGQTALLAAARYAFDRGDSLGARRAFDVLLQHGAAVGHADASGTTALLLLLGAHAPPGQDGDATHIGALLPRLLGAGADPAHADKRGVTALHACALHALLGPARTLIGRGAPLGARDAWGRTPAEVAQKLGYIDLALELEPRRVPGVNRTLLRPAAED